MPAEIKAPQLKLVRNDSETQLTLWFSSEGRVELVKTAFRSPLIDTPIVAVRGKTGGAFNTTATFQWTSAVQALATLMLKAVRRERLNLPKDEPLLEGSKGTMAASLDASIYKQNAWLDLFGANVRGDSLSRRVLARSNPGRRRCGPVMISLNEKLLPASAVVIMLDNQRIDDEVSISRCLGAIEKQWQAPAVQLALPLEEALLAVKVKRA